jgi:hypothetical protein
MARPRNVTPSRNLNVRIRAPLLDELSDHLFDELEQAVPYGAFSRFFEERITEFFRWKKIPLDLYGYPPGFFVVGPAEMTEEIIKQLEEEAK